ncbi:hypothetical protein [Paenibacillus cucumis (ex Kampfer et al. 2016)]|uniref:Uncharacterized protein n=1 Tax=Paenibacillus cucumis (ex Kampfer et al. 2016) TaxID=1776858 RepID=A0ABS7KMA6_9BACL|nr:hypothetical protein [Paenibacillus cucumis (ex Kampfer et al. 2016)]MBY0205264.1 hypothetical protein [Paenibacillus cucumis (ex Kampfer et al. 2016)]
MKLHKDGTVEGTPQEIAEYSQLGDATLKSLDCTLVGALNALNRRAIEAPSKQQRDAIIREADELRNRMESLKEQSAIEGVYKEIGEIKQGQPVANLRAYLTKDLVSALKGRTGVEVHGMGKEVEFSLISGSLRHDRKGKATVLIIQE